MSERILITGAQGFVGRYATAAFLRQGATVLGTGRSRQQQQCFTHQYPIAGDLRPAPLPAELANPSTARYSYVPCDLADAEAVASLVRDARPDRVVHLAGALRDESEQALIQSNTLATGNLMTAVARHAAAAMVVLGSSGSVYGAQPRLPVAESAEPAPVGSYAQSKRASEQVAEAVAREAGLDLAVARIFNLVGPGIQSRHLPGYLAHLIAEIEAGKRASVIELGSLSTTRDLIDVRDVADWLVRLPRSAGITYWNVASGKEVSMTTLVECFIRYASVPIEVKTDDARSRVGADRLFAETRIRTLLPASITLEQSVLDMLAYARACAVALTP